MFNSILFELKITREEYNSLGVQCVETKLPVPRQQITNSGGLRTEDLGYAADLESIYAGDFQRVGLARDSFEVAVLVVGFRSAFSESCASSLPANKVEITEKKCEREEWQEYGNGMEVVGSRHCATYRAVGTGKYADPDVDDLADRLQANQLTKGWRDLPEAMRDMSGYISSKAGIEKSAKKDMHQLLALNGCASQVTKRFQTNLLRFGAGSPAIDIRSPITGGKVKATIAPLSGWSALVCGSGCSGENEPVIKMLWTPNSQRPMVLECQYESQSGLFSIYYFWSGAPPANIKALLAVDKKGVLRFLGTKSAQRCPETSEKAWELRQSAMRETGFPPH